MKAGLFSVYDVKTEAYLPPFVALTFGEAERRFKDLVDSPDTLFHRHPGDFMLFKVGDFDSVDGSVSPVTEQVRVQLGDVGPKLAEGGV